MRRARIVDDPEMNKGKGNEEVDTGNLQTTRKSG